jgi:uncharacterized protein (DUF427 family)
MARAIWNGKVIAESDTTETVEGNIYFPDASLKREFFSPQQHHIYLSLERPGALSEPADRRAG